MQTDQRDDCGTRGQGGRPEETTPVHAMIFGFSLQEMRTSVCYLGSSVAFCVATIVD